MPNGDVVYGLLHGLDDTQLYQIDTTSESIGRSLRKEGVPKDVALAPNFTPDARHMLYERGKSLEHSNNDIYLVDLAGDGGVRPLLTKPANEGEPTLFPNGAWLAYQTDGAGRFQIVLRRFAPKDGSVGDRVCPVSFEGGVHPFWSPDGTELFYTDPTDDDLMGVKMNYEPAFNLSTPQVILTAEQLDRYDTWGGSPIDIMPDGKELVYIANPETSGVPDHLNIILNWFEENEALPGCLKCPNNSPPSRLMNTRVVAALGPRARARPVDLQSGCGRCPNVSIAPWHTARNHHSSCCISLVVAICRLAMEQYIRLNWIISGSPLHRRRSSESLPGCTERCRETAFWPV